MNSLKSKQRKKKKQTTQIVHNLKDRKLKQGTENN